MDRNCVVVYDACVLFPAPLRDLLMELSVLSHGKKLFRPKWTDKIHDEWINNLLDEIALVLLADIKRLETLNPLDIDKPAR